MNHITRIFAGCIPVILLVAGINVNAADTDVQPLKHDNVGYLTVIEKPANCQLPKLKLEKSVFKENRITTYLTVEHSKDGSHWIIGQRRFLKDPKKAHDSSGITEPVTAAVIHCDNSMMVSDL